MTKKFVTTLASIALLAFLGAEEPSPTIEIASVAPAGFAGNGGSGIQSSSSNAPPGKRISADNRYVVFESEAFNLVCGNDSNSSQDVFRRDRLAGTTILVSVAVGGAQANDASFSPSLSADGRYVAFESAATNLVPGSDTNFTNDIFWRDIDAGITKRVSVSSEGIGGNFVAHFPAISADGRYVAFISNSSNLVPGDTNGVFDVFVHDVATGVTERVSISASGEEGSVVSVNPSISGDGRYVLFLSSNRFDPAWMNNGTEMFLRDRQTGTIRLVTPTASNGLANASIHFAEISRDGRWVAFQSNSDNIVTPDANGFSHEVFVRDLVNNTTTRVSASSAGVQGNQDSFVPAISQDGRYVAFHSRSSNLVAGDNANQIDVFLRDVVAGTTTRVSVGLAGVEANNTSEGASISDDGTVVTFMSMASNVVTNDANGNRDVFVYGPRMPGSESSGFRFSSATYSVVESGSAASITIVRSGGDPCASATVHVATSDGSATSDDYTSLATTLTFGPGETSKTVTVAITDDAADEADETVTLTLSDATGAPLGSPFSATLTIGDDDEATPPGNGAPDAVPDQYGVVQDRPLIIPSSVGVLANDTDPDGDALVAAVVAQPAHGTLTLARDGSFTYTPAAGFTGNDGFTYQASDLQQASSAPAIVTVTVQNGEGRISTCRSIIPAVLHPMSSVPRAFMGDPFVGNRRLTPIENDTVPCVEVDTMETARCIFETGQKVGAARAVRYSGDWLEDRSGRRYAVVGQPVTRDGSLSSGAFVVGTVPDADLSVPCVGATGRDAAGGPAPGGSDMRATGYVEIGGGSTNASGGFLLNFADRFVGTSDLVHPDGARQVASDPVRGIAWYTDQGAALNDVNGERDVTGTYYGMEWSTHLVVAGGVQVPAGKRPSTKSYPAPGRVNINSPIRWTVVNPYVDIANGSPIDPRLGNAPIASFTFSVDAGIISLDASSSIGDIVHYVWSLSWTDVNPDAASTSPTITFPLPAGPPRSVFFGTIGLTVIARDGQTATTFREIGPSAPTAAFTASLGLVAVYLDATASTGDIVNYAWDLDWTAANPDATSPVPVIELPLLVIGARTNGFITLTVTSRDGRTATKREQVNFKRKIPSFPPSPPKAPK